MREKSSLYTDREIEGLGKNFVTEESRKQGIEAYSFFIGYYVLSSLKDRVARILEKENREAVKTIYTDETGEAEWEYQKSLLHLEGLAKRSVGSNLEELLRMQEKIAESTAESKERDDIRGRRIQREYYDAHTEASQDPFVLETREEMEKLEREIRSLLAVLQSGKKEVKRR